MSRVNARTADASDATSAIVARQTVENIGTVSWHQLRADRPPEQVVADAMTLSDSTK